jgi:ribosomal protein L7/L12
MKKVQIYSIGLVIFAWLEILMPASAFTEALMVTVLLLIAEIISVEDLPLAEEAKIQLKEDFDNAISHNDKVKAIKAYRKLNDCGIKEAKIHVENILTEIKVS